MTLQLTLNLISVFGKYKAAETKSERERKARLNALKESIELTKYEISSAMDNFNNVTEPKLIDFYIYKIQSEQNRYEQLLGEYKVLEKTPYISASK